MNVPKLRFKEFNDEWKDKKLKDIVIFSKGNILSKNDLDDNGKFPCILYGQLYTKYKEIIREIFSKTNNDSPNIVKSKIGDVLMPSSGETPIDISTSSCLMLGNILIGGDINILSPKENCNGRFLSYMINNNKKVEIAKVAQGHSIVHLYNDNLRDIIIKMPSLKEQNQVANVLELLDKKIELQSKKIEALKLYKKGLYKLYFSSNSRNYKEIPLKNICKITTGKLDANAMVKNGKYRFYTCAKDYYYIDEYAFDTEALLISGNGAYVGYIHYYKGKFNAYQRTYVLTDFKYNAKYIKCYLECFLSKRINSEKKEGNTPYIVMGTLSNMNIKLPSKEEQERISSNFDLLTDKINLEEIKLNKLESLKKGLIQNMVLEFLV